MRKIFIVFAVFLVSAIFFITTSSLAKKEFCVNCHKSVTPLRVKDWGTSEHSDNGVEPVEKVQYSTFNS